MRQAVQLRAGQGVRADRGQGARPAPRVQPPAHGLTLLLALLLAAAGAAQEKPPSDPLKAFLEGDDAARKSILDRGAELLPAAGWARIKHPVHRRSEALQDLVVDLKEKAAGEPARAAFKSLREKRMTIDMQNAPLAAVVDYAREVSGLNLAVDPRLDKESSFVTFKISDVPLWQALDGVCQRSRLDWEFRYGVLFLAAPERLWPPPPDPPLSDEQKAAARGWIKLFASDSPDERDRATAQLRALGSALVPTLEEEAKSKDEETAARCKLLVSELRPRTVPGGRLPKANHWTSQELSGPSLTVAAKLRSMKIDLAFENTRLSDIVSFIRDFSGLNIVLDSKSDDPLYLKVKDLSAAQVLELLTLPLGLDVKIEQGVVTIFERR